MEPVYNHIDELCSVNKERNDSISVISGSVYNVVNKDANRSGTSDCKVVKQVINSNLICSKDIDTQKPKVGKASAIVKPVCQPKHVFSSVNRRVVITQQRCVKMCIVY